MEFAQYVPDSIIHNRNLEPPSDNIKRPNPVVNNNQENDQMKHNSSYASRAASAKKLLILCGSICSRIKMKEFNRELKNGHAYRKQFPGASSQEMAHYCIPTVRKDSPNTVIIQTGMNDLRNKEDEEIIKNIVDIVEICERNGANNVYVSAITFREQFNEKVS